MRLVPAAQQLVAQVTEARSVSAVGITWEEADGFGRIRELTFDPSTSAWLMPILMAVRDPRIQTLASSPARPQRKGGFHLTVTFVPDVRADRADPFAIKEAAEVLDDPAP
jgi:hypothetical protein